MQCFGPAVCSPSVYCFSPGVGSVPTCLHQVQSYRDQVSPLEIRCPGTRMDGLAVPACGMWLADHGAEASVGGPEAWPLIVMGLVVMGLRRDVERRRMCCCAVVRDVRLMRPAFASSRTAASSSASLQAEQRVWAQAIGSGIHLCVRCTEAAMHTHARLACTGLPLPWP